MTKNFVINTEAAIHRNNKWLVGLRSEKESEAPGLLSLVGGTVDSVDTAPKDLLEEALLREVKEEVGAEVFVEDFVNNTYFVSKKGNNVLNVVFLCSLKQESQDPVITDTQEFDELLWLSLEEVLEHPGSPQWLCDSLVKASALLNKGL